ncbi:MAG: hypothetical protein R3A52_26440 [Polyangiales bacterium]
MRARAVTLGLAFLALGCGDALPSPAVVDAPRVLALTTATPDVRPGSEVTVRALWFDPSNRDVAFRWRLCREVSGFDPRACAVPSVGRDLDATTERVTLPPSALSLDASEREGTWVLWLLACPGSTASVRDGRYQCALNDGVEVFRRVGVRREGALNTPPSITSITLDGRALTDGATLPLPRCDGACAPLTVSVTPREDAVETAPDGVAEALLLSVYVTGGSVSPVRDAAARGERRVMSVRWTPPSEGEVRAWIALRDQRGGESVVSVRFVR